MNTLIKPPCTNDRFEDKVDIPWLHAVLKSHTDKNIQRISIFDKLKKISGLLVYPIAAHNVVALLNKYCGTLNELDYSDDDTDEYTYKKVTASISVDKLKVMSGKHCKLFDFDLWIIYPDALAEAWMNFSYPFDDFPEDMSVVGSECPYSLMIEQVENKFEAAFIGPLGYIGETTEWPIRFADLIISSSKESNYAIQTQAINTILNTTIYRSIQQTPFDSVESIVTTFENDAVLNTMLLPVKLTFNNMSIDMYKETLYNSTAYEEDEIEYLQKVYATDPICTYYNPVDDTILVVLLSNWTGENKSHIMNFEVDYDYINPIYNYNMVSMSPWCGLDGKDLYGSSSRHYISIQLKLLDIFTYNEVTMDTELFSRLDNKYYTVPNITCELIDRSNKTVNIYAQQCFVS